MARHKGANVILKVMISIIVAVSENGIIGSGGTMPWHISEDLRRFKALTLGHAVIMGRKTYESIGQPLAGRQNIVITRNPDLEIEGCTMAPSLDKALELSAGDTERFVIGGGEIFRQALPSADRLYITHVGITADGDTTFPPIGPEWEEYSREQFECGKNFPHPFAFISYRRK